MNSLVERLTEAERDQTSPNLRPRNAATLIVVDRCGAIPKVLMGRRHANHAFMPSKFVFPGGRVETQDARMSSAGELAPIHAERLTKFVSKPGPRLARALALAAIRETAEETGLLLGRRGDRVLDPPGDEWRMFTDAGIVPDLSPLQFVARAITPPRRNRRFDARFFAVEAEHIAHRVEGVVGPQAELDEVVWIPIEEARGLDLPTITRVVLDELQQRLDSGFDPNWPVPFYRMLHKRFVRALL